MIFEVEEWLNLNSEEGVSSFESDLVWIAMFIVLHYNGWIKIKIEQKDWDSKLAYFKDLLLIQRFKK